MGVDINYDLSASLQVIDGFRTESYDPSSGGPGDLDFPVQAKICDSAPGDLVTMKPGQAVGVCVCTDSYPVVSVDTIESLTFSTTTTAVTKSMLAVDDGSPVGGRVMMGDCGHV